MQFRVDRATEGPSGYQLLWVFGCIWTLGRFVRELLLLAGVADDAMSVRLAETLAWSCTILGPFAIGRFLQARIGRKNARLFLALTLAASVCNLCLFAWAGIHDTFDLDTSWYPQASLYVALGMTAVAMMLYYKHRQPVPQRSSQRWFGRGAFLLAAIHVTAALLSLEVAGLPSSLRSAMDLISGHWAIPWSILIAVSLAQIHYADVVLKRSLWLLASVTLAAMASTFVFRISQGFLWVTSTLSCAALILSAPLLVRTLNFLIDRLWLNRPDYATVEKAFEDSLRQVYDQQQIFESAQRTVQSTLRLQARVLPTSEPPSTQSLAKIPMGIDGTHLEVTATHLARTLMQREIEFLNAIGTRVKHRLEALRFEQEQRALQFREERLKRLLTEAELKALRMQIDPHFLFNTLNTIADLISSNPQQAERMTERLAECFRYALSRHSKHLSTLDEELEFARHYLDIEQERFGDRLRVQLSRGDASGTEPIPTLLLQPLLENAIKHGLAPLREGGSISVIAQREGASLRVQVSDDGVGLRPDFGSRLGIGLQNVKERLQTLYPHAASMMIDSATGGRGTIVTIRVPVHGH